MRLDQMRMKIKKKRRDDTGKSQIITNKSSSDNSNE